jgi:hypothetical protein
MKTMKTLLGVLSLAAAMNATAALTCDVSGGAGNNTGVFGFFDPQTPWTSGDIALPANTIIGATPLEVDLVLSQNVTLNSSAHYSWFFNYGGSGIATGNDLGSLYMVLTENGTPLNNNQIGFDAGLSGFPNSVNQFGTGYYDAQLQNMVFNGVQIFVSNADPGGENLTDLQISLDSAQPVPETSTMVAGALLLIPFASGAIRPLRKKLHTAC